MDDDARRRKKIQEWTRLRDVPPEVTLTMGFDLMTFARDLREAADRAER